jgi:hypothetical protein
VIFSGNEFLAIKVAAAATPVAGLAAVAHIRARRRRAGAIETGAARRASRTAVIDVAMTSAVGSGTVSIELTPHLLACLAAARSAHLPGYPTPDTVMMAPRVEAHWKTHRRSDADEFQSPSRLIVTREFMKIRSTLRSIESIPVSLRDLLEAHRSIEEGLPLHCRADGVIDAEETRVLRVGALRSREDFPEVQAQASSAQPPASPP